MRIPSILGAVLCAYTVFCAPLDPEEENNLAKEYPATLETLVAAYPHLIELDPSNNGYKAKLGVPVDAQGIPMYFYSADFQAESKDLRKREESPSPAKRLWKRAYNISCVGGYYQGGLSPQLCRMACRCTNGGDPQCQDHYTLNWCFMAGTGNCECKYIGYVPPCHGCGREDTPTASDQAGASITN
ncbi:hypothetical protein TWF694_011737 [Orbilia ellipsospora]|uniref:Uncharacterized protein n=1 Tax=Orbilia ellipsospora TaxID=2528407 RepID=A0AAV9X7B1_9PEZI